MYIYYSCILKSFNPKILGQTIFFHEKPLSFFLLIIAVCRVSSHANAQAWNSVGKVGFSTGRVDFVSIAFGNDSRPYVAYADGSNNGVTVMTCKLNTWQVLGDTGFSTGEVGSSSIAIDKDDTPYVVITDYTHNKKATVMKYDGSNWKIVGSAGFTVGEALGPSIAIDGKGTVFVSFVDSIDNHAATVMKFDGSNWVTVGSAGFSIVQVGGLQMALDANGIPYVVYSDYNVSQKATVMKFSGTNWELVGAEGFSAGQVDGTGITIDQAGVPIIVFTDFSVDHKATVMKFNGTNWEFVGRQGFSDGETTYTAIAIGIDGNPYVAYSYHDYPFVDYTPVTVMKFDGSDWITVGKEGFSMGSAFAPSLTMSKSGTPYVAYTDDANDGKATVMKFDIETEVKKINKAAASVLVSPNPTTGSFTLQIPQTNSPTIITITNLLGSIIETRTIENTQPLNLNFDLHNPPGTYIIKVSSGDNVWREKVVVW